MSLATALVTLQNAFHKQIYDGSLNVAVRKALRQFATAEALQFQQDSAGNIYISRHGRDSELADIALSFPLDAQETPAAFTSAFRVFDQLIHDNLISTITLFGYTTISGKAIGRQLWERPQTPWNDSGAISLQSSLLQQFSAFASPADINLSARFEIVELPTETLELHGSALLINKARDFVEDLENVLETVGDSPRAPQLIIRGKVAESVAIKAIREYSHYIAALFDNFD